MVCVKVVQKWRDSAGTSSALFTWRFFPSIYQSTLRDIDKIISIIPKVHKILVCQLNLLLFNYYRPQRSWGKVIFSQASVILFTGGICLSACWDTTPPPPRTRQAPSQDQVPPGTRNPPPQSRAYWEIRSTSRRYAFYWNAILFLVNDRFNWTCDKVSGSLFKPSKTMLSL